MERPHIRRCLRPLIDAGLVDEVTDGHEVAPDVTVISLPGHDPGHVGIRIDGQAILIADAAVHPALLAEPDWVYAFDDDDEGAAGTRRDLVAELADSDVLVVSGHYPGGGIGRVLTRNGRVVWEAASG
jgi:glyoxylase-like metal-dependent hydrolase (beta-lactamase superfamily II)